MPSMSWDFCCLVRLIFKKCHTSFKIAHMCLLSVIPERGGGSDIVAMQEELSQMLFGSKEKKYVASDVSSDEVSFAEKCFDARSKNVALCLKKLILLLYRHTRGHRHP